MMQFYQMEGRWPNNINELGTSRVAVFDENFVTQIQFDYDGSMVLNLDSDNFEHDAMISLQPIDKGMRVEWKCVTNLDNSYRGSFCQRVE